VKAGDGKSEGRVEVVIGEFCAQIAVVNLITAIR
jgi:hypothetical protein